MISGVKDDDGKAPLYRGLLELFPLAASEVARVSAYGARKYAWTNWHNVDDGFYRYSNALVRHLTREGTDKGLDVDSRFLHATHVAWNSLARLEIILKERELGYDRYEQTRPEGPAESKATDGRPQGRHPEPYSEGSRIAEVQATGLAQRTEEVWR